MINFAPYTYWISVYNNSSKSPHLYITTYINGSSDKGRIQFRDTSGDTYCVGINSIISIAITRNHLIYSFTHF